jgi:hypothetical protein
MYHFHNPRLQQKTKEMQLYRFVLLSVSIVVIYYCINFSSFLSNTAIFSVTQSPKVKQLRPTQDLNLAPTNVKVIENIQGSVPHPIIRRNAGSLTHIHVDTKELGSVDNCSMQGNRIKHIIKSSASSLTWEEKDEPSWEIFNDRGNSNPDIKTESKLQYVVIKDNVGTADETITYVDQTAATQENISITQEGEWMAQDPRVIFYNDKRIIIYHSKVQRQMWLYDHVTKQAVMLTICGHGTDGIQKNWSPVVISDTILLLVYTLDPLVILQYDVEKGDGVCMLIYGHLPLRSGMDEPFGGTPFVEINLPDNQDECGVVARSFLSVGHSRRANDLISKDRSKKSHRVYRPVPIVLHLFCVSSHDENDNKQGVDTLTGCTFGTDVYDLWHEVESPSFLLKTKWKKSERKTRSVSFPYDLHVFPDNNMIRVGLEYEDCYSVYEDYEVDFGAIWNLQLTHPMRVALEGQSNNEHKADDLAFSPTLVRSSYCPSVYSHSGEEKLYVSPYTSEDKLAQHIVGKIWIVSHKFRQREGQEKQEFDSIFSSRESRRKDIKLKGGQLDGVLDHYPYPIEKMTEGKSTLVPKLCIYIYGSM